MPCTVLVGAQWGDEGKGKIIDVLTEDVDMVVRFQGGANAGHTVKIGDEQYVLHLVPSGIFREEAVCVVGNGLVVDPLDLVSEIKELVERGIKVDGRLFLSDRAHIVFPWHKAIDAQKEAALKDGKKIGTTKRGIGPTYCDKASRTGLRMGDLVDPSLPELFADRLDGANAVLTALGGEALDKAPILAQYQEAADYLRPLVTDTIPLINGALKDNKNVLMEGAQGTMLDIDFGSYPFVTSSNTTAGGGSTGAGIPPSSINRVVAVIKAYTTRVGEGPFPTELEDEVGEQLRAVGGEFGATTGRPRRCGWFDGVVARYAAMVSGVDYWAMTKLDVLDQIEKIKVCVAYECDGKRYETIPASVEMLKRCTPIYEEHEGWCTSTEEVTKFDDLPQKAKDYVTSLCELTGVELGILSVGPRRKSTLRIAI